MLAEFSAGNTKDKNGNPTGGEVRGTGLRIDWQNGPLGRDGDRIAPNGAFVETVIASAKQRLAFYQDSKYKCVENQVALDHLEKALAALDSRTKKREEQKVEGLHEVHN